MTELWDLRPLDPALMAAADLLDLGAGKGNRLAREAQQFGAEHPLGLDRDRAKVARGQAAGRPVYEADFTQLDAHAFPNVKVVVFDNVLEHLPSLDVVELAFERACAIAPRVLYIRHPSFEDTDYLDSLGVKQYWTDWQGHTAHVRVQELIDMATSRGVYDILVRPIRRAHGTDDPTILPASAPPNQRKAKRVALRSRWALPRELGARRDSRCSEALALNEGVRLLVEGLQRVWSAHDK